MVAATTVLRGVDAGAPIVDVLEADALPGDVLAGDALTDDEGELAVVVRASSPPHAAVATARKHARTRTLRELIITIDSERSAWTEPGHPGTAEVLGVYC